MSLLTLFMADAAAAHGHEYSRPRSTDSLRPFQAHDEPAVIPSPVSSTPAEQAPTQKKPKPKTSFHLAQPPPTSHHIHRHRHQLRRALVLQAQKLSISARPLPTLDVLPAAALGSKLRKLVGCFKQGVGQQDLVFLTSEEYTSGSDAQSEDDDDEELNGRHIVASVSQGYRKLNAERGMRTTVIDFPDGLQWEASPLLSGGYEFCAYDAEGTMLVARWTLKLPNSRRHSYQSAQQRDVAEQRRFQFSLATQSSRKRPVIAWLSKNNIDVLDKQQNAFASVQTSPAVTPSTPDILSKELGYPFTIDQRLDDSELVPISEQTRNLALVTGIWVALKENLARNNFLSEQSPASPGLTMSRPSGSLRSRSSTNGSSASRLSGADETARKTLLRQGSMLAHQATTTFRDPGSQTPDNPRRAHSVGNMAKMTHRSWTPGVSHTAHVPEVVFEDSIPSTRSASPEAMTSGYRTPPPQLLPESHNHANGGIGRPRHSQSLPSTPSRFDATPRSVAFAEGPPNTRRADKGGREKRRWSFRAMVGMLKRTGMS